MIELILVMALLIIVLSVAAPSLARFFQGRALDSEVRRFLALTRHGQNRAVSEGQPFLLWIDVEKRAYGLLPEISDPEMLAEDPLEEDRDRREYALARGVEVEVDVNETIASSVWLTPAGSAGPASSAMRATGLTPVPWQRTLQLVGMLPTIRFTPDGFIAETSPAFVGFREGEATLAGEAGWTWVGLSRNRLNYEIWTNPPPMLR